MVGKTLSQFLITHNMKSYGKVEVQLHEFLTLALDESDWTASHP
jgi:hypothetical protein